MGKHISEALQKNLVCCQCGQVLALNEAGASCASCDIRYPYTAAGTLDLRLQKAKIQTLEFELGTALLPEDAPQFDPLAPSPSPQVDFSGIRTPWHLSSELLSYFPKGRAQNALMLDLGCGSGVHREVCERAGFQWVGVDHESNDALILADAHALPFASGSFEFILSIAVLEHLRFPFVAMREAHRILKPGGRFVGTVAFLEPFHGDSFYHHTHLGTFNSLQYGGFRIEKLAPSAGWSVLKAQASMGLFPKMPTFLSGALLFPIQLLHKIWWRIAARFSDKASEAVRIRNTTGVFSFVAVKL